MTDAITYPHGYPVTGRSKVRLNVGWRFHLGDVPADSATAEPVAAAGAAFDDSDWELVNIPHTFSLTSLNLDDCDDDKTQPTFHRDVGWYRRSLTVDADPERKVFLEFEGAHQVTDVWVNGHHVGQHAISGYTPFHFDVTDFVTRDGENVVALRADNRVNPDVPPDPGPSDYVHFSGLYREVYLVQTERVYLPFPWESRTAGVTITTPTVKTPAVAAVAAATVDVKISVRNVHAEPRTCTVLTRVIDTQGVVVLRMQSTQEIPAGGEVVFSQCNGIDEDVHLWSCDDPYLYRVNTLVFDGERPVDCIENPLGLRTFELRADQGFLLNGEPLMLVGVNRHQHYPYIGDAVPKSLHRKDALQFKATGFNVVRLAHYPHDNAFIEMCDELGILVCEEAPSWINFGTGKWTENLEEALRRAVRNHKNHPSVFTWGGGINHRGSFEPLHYAAKEEDPTRWTASNHSPWSGAQHAGICDIYTNMDYRDIALGDEPLFAMEHGASPDGERAQVLVSRYKGDPRRFGTAAWTAHAYYTFHPPQPGQRYRTRGGMMDAFRIPRPVIAWYQSELTDTPMVRVADAWREGLTRLRVFSNCDEVELVVNGTSLGRRRPDTDPEKANLDHPPFTFQLCWQPGKLIALGWKDGRVQASDIVQTPGAPVGVDLTVDMADRDFVADGADIVMVYARVVDLNGTTVTGYDGKVTFSVAGPAEIVGGPEIGANPMECFDGVAPVLVRAGLEPALIAIKAEADGLTPGEAFVPLSLYTADVIAATARPIYDLARVRLDLGGEGQHVQYGWLPWIGEDGPAAEIVLDQLAGAILTLHPVDSDVDGGGRLRWRGESNVPGPLGFVAEDGVCAVGELALTFAGLPAGHYRVRTYHHGPSSETDSMDPLRDKVYAVDISKLPPAVSLDVGVSNGARRWTAAAYKPQGQGKRIGPEGPTCIDIAFSCEGTAPVTVRLTSTDGAGSIWLNGLDLRQVPAGE